MDSADTLPLFAGSVGPAIGDGPLETKSLTLIALPGNSAVMRDAVEPWPRVEDLNCLLMELTADGIYGMDAKGITTFVNPAIAKMTGWTAEELLGKPHHTFADHVPPDGASSLGELLLASDVTPRCPARNAAVWRGEDAVFLRKDGTIFPAAYTWTSILQQGKLLGTIVVFRDISIQRRRERWEKTRNEIFSAIIGHHALSSTMQTIADAFTAFHPSKSIAIFLLLGEEFHLEAEAGLPQRPSRPGHATPDDQVSGVLAAPGDFATLGRHAVSGLAACPMFREIIESGVRLCLVSPLISGSGEASGAVAVFDHHSDLVDDSARETIQGVCDLACVAIEHQKFYEEVVHRSHYDRPTGLPNRLFLEGRLRQTLGVARLQGKLVGVCCLDLDHFKQINDTLGHELGDSFFKAVSERLNLSIRKIDLLALQSGDEFILVLCELEEASDADRICNRLLRDLKEPILVEGHSLVISASVGISIFPQHGETVDLLLRNADMALRAAKRAGVGLVQIYSPALGRQIQRATEMVEALVNAVAQDQFRMAYQPICNMSKEIVAFEALLRWKHPKWGQISPLEFIPIAENTGLIVPMGDWVIKEVCRQAMEWDSAALPPVKIFANVSGVQLGRPDFASKIADTLRQSGLAPNRLELEITESWIISDLKGAAHKLQLLRDLGIGIAIDDFGTGYSTFNYLQELPLDTLKIDRSFLRRLDASATHPSTVRAITGLAHQLGLKTVAEGVETEDHVAELGESGCDLMQGFFLARPLKAYAAASLLRKQQTAGAFLNLPTQTPFAEPSPAEYLAMHK
jgi:diguanylate cyclase (GGDEF)-like protein/PAS domain S-box-containing protein